MISATLTTRFFEEKIGGGNPLVRNRNNRKGSFHDQDEKMASWSVGQCATMKP
jgi:hypothetical protein